MRNLEILTLALLVRWFFFLSLYFFFGGVSRMCVVFGRLSLESSKTSRMELVNEIDIGGERDCVFMS